MLHSLRVFVAASSGANLRQLLGSLRESGHYVVFSSDGSNPGELISSASRKAIAGSDLALLVLTEGNSTGAAFEAGLAAALGIPILVATTQRAKIPTQLQGFPTISFKLSDPSRVAHALQVLSLEMPNGTRTAQETPLGANLAHYWSALNSNSEAERVRLLSAAIEETGAIVVRTEEGGDEGFDIAVWSEDLISSIGATVMVEVVKHFSPETRKQVRTALRLQPPGTIGLVVYESASSTAAATAAYEPQILAIQERLLLESLQGQTFAQIVMRLRNSAIHARLDD